MWDLRSGLCTQTFFGHGNAVSHVSFNLQGDSIVSSDADGTLKLWDIRSVSERLEVVSPAPRHPVNETLFDPSGNVLISAVEDGTIKV
jgi:WD40 repeat protein